MKKSFCAACFIILCFFFIGCISFKNKPDQNFISNKEEAILFGKIQISQNDLNDTSSAHKITLIPLNSTAAEPCCFDSHAHFYSKQIDTDDGYFFISIPPGRYCFYLMQYFPSRFLGFEIKKRENLIHIFPDHNERQKTNPFEYALSNNSLIYFDVLPNQANYFGTIKIDTSCCYFPLCQGNQKPVRGYQLSGIDQQITKNMPFWKYVCSSPKIGVDGWNIIDEKEEAFKVFKSFYPNHSEPSMVLSSLTKKISTSKNDEPYEFVDLTKYKITSVFLGGPK